MPILAILTDNDVKNIIGFVVAGMLGTIAVLIGYIWNERKKMADEDRAESQAWREEMHDRFEAINAYISFSKGKHQSHDNNIKGVVEKQSVLFKIADNNTKDIQKVQIDFAKLKTKDNG